MAERPKLKTERLFLRPFTLDDAPEVQKLAGDKAVAETTLNIPHPYEDGMAEEWIKTHKEQFDLGKLANFAITKADDGALIGAIGLVINSRHERAEMGYWVGKPLWNKGYGTEAARAVLHYGFTELNLNKIFAHYMTRNPASGKIMEKMGMQFEGLARQHVKKWGVFEDFKMYSILRSEYKP